MKFLLYRVLFCLIIITALSIMPALPLNGQSVNLSVAEIIQRVDEAQTFETLRAEGTMISTNMFGEKRSDYISYSRRGGDFLIEFTNSDQAGEKVLRLGNQIFLYYPDAENVLTLSGSSLKNSMFGDVSYEDLTDGRNTNERYTSELIATETVDGIACWKIELTARDRDVAYPAQTIWVHQQLYYAVRGEYYSRSGRLLKEISISDVSRYGDKIYPQHILVTDRVRRGSSTEIIMNTVQIDQPLPASTFSRSALR